MNDKFRMFCRLADFAESVHCTEFGYPGRSWYHMLWKLVQTQLSGFRSKDYGSAVEENPTPPTEDETPCVWLEN